jgi:hypothetical protein
MKRLSVVLSVLSLAAAGCKSGPEMRSDGMDMGVEYQVTFSGTWTAESHPLEYPKAGVVTGPHFSGLIGATHNGGYAIIKDGAPPTPGLERLSEEGKHSPLDEEIKASIAAGLVGALFETGPIKDLMQSVETRVRVDEKHPMVSAVAMIAPSPDWFAGAADVNLMADGKWVDSVQVPLYAYDSGGDDGATYEAPDMDANPKHATMLNASKHFVGADGKKIPVGKLTFKKL